MTQHQTPKPPMLDPFQRGFALGLLTMAIAAFLVVMVATRPVQGAEVPRVTHQETTATGTRRMTISNPTHRPLWLYIECERVLTVHPIAAPAKRVFVLEMKDSEPITNDCYLNHWVVQTDRSPEAWNP